MGRDFQSRGSGPTPSHFVMERCSHRYVSVSEEWERCVRCEVFRPQVVVPEGHEHQWKRKSAKWNYCECGKYQLRPASPTGSYNH